MNGRNCSKLGGFKFRTRNCALTMPHPNEIRVHPREWSRIGMGVDGGGGEGM